MKRKIVVLIILCIIFFVKCSRYKECSCENIFEGYLYALRIEVFDSFSGNTVTTSAILSEVPISNLYNQYPIEYDSRVRCICGNLTQKVEDLNGKKVRCCIVQRKKIRPRIIEGTGVPVFRIICIEDISGND